MGQVFVQAYRALPGLKPMGDKSYEFIRDHRYQLFGQRNDTYQSAYACADGRCEQTVAQGESVKGQQK
jgi:predicted DCC family thiol-disulfide oxidoreductase YuxK